MMLSQAEIIY